jgi:ubiquinone biosynthesis protein
VVVVNWRALIPAAELEKLLSPEYVRFAVAAKEGLAIFLSGLPEEVQASVVQDQFRLGKTATLSQRLGQLARCSPVLHKLGQILARNPKLAPSLRIELQKLEWLRPSLPSASIKTLLEREIGSLEAHGISLAPHALAEASVAVVIPFAGTAPRRPGDPIGFDGVFKLLKPGIEERLHLEQELLRQVGSLLDEQCPHLDIPVLEYREIFNQVTEALHNEVLLEQEQRNLLEAAACFRRDPSIQIPRLLEPCSSRVTAMERIRGRKLDAAAIDSLEERKRLADLVVTALVVQPIFSSADRALFHGDPHAGNLFYTEDGRLAALDWSQAGHLATAQRRSLSQLMLAAMTLRPERMATLIAGLARGPVPDSAGLRRAVERSLRSIRTGRLPGFSWLVSLLDSAVEEGRLLLPANISFFRKALLTVTGIVVELSGDQDRADRVVMQEFMRIFAEEWPWRWHHFLPGSTRTSHLSNADLLDAAMTAFVHSPQSFADYWFRLLQ